MRIAIMSRNRRLYSTGRLIDEVRKREIEPVVLNPLKCDLLVGDLGGHVYYGRRKLPPIDVVIPRIGATVTRYGLNVLRKFIENGIPTISDPEGIVIARDKFHTLQTLARNGMLVPKTVMVREPAHLTDAIDRVGGFPAVVKLIRGTQGKGVILVESRKSALSTFDALWSLGQQMLIQEFVLESNGTDIRCIVVDGKVVASCRRIARIGEFRSNYHKGGIIEPVDLSEAQKDVAVRAAGTLGIGVAGVDMLDSAKGLMVIEVNASPGFQGIEKATAVNVAGAIVDFAVDTAKRNAKGRS